MRLWFKRALCLVLVVASLVPLLELFDRWDAPGLGNDTELRLFLMIAFVALTLWIARVVARRSQLPPPVMTALVWPMVWALESFLAPVSERVAVTGSPPLRI